jgi:tRNA threonylcarbamoyladenosine biosynthesis protein TsaB
MPAPAELLLPLLALDTATEHIALGVQAVGRAHTRQAAGGAAASVQLLPQIHALLAEAGLTLQDVRCIAFGRGPGAFTGLRTACSVAQGLGFGLGVPLVPLDTLMLVAESARDSAAEPELDVAVAIDARMDEVYAARYRWQPGAGVGTGVGAGVGVGSWAVLAEPALYTLAGLAVAWAPLAPHRLAGNAGAVFGSRLEVPAHWPRATEGDRAAALLRLAVQQAAAQGGIDAAAALPLYLRDKVALTTQERQAARLAGTAATLATAAAAGTAAAAP